MKVIAITGTRRDTRKGEVAAYLDGEQPTIVIVGCAPGRRPGACVDQEARDWARERALLIVVYAAWRAPGKVDPSRGYWPGAGNSRNAHLSRIARHYRSHFRDVWCAAFPDDDSRGTWDCVERMRDVPSVETRYPGDPKWQALAEKKGLWP